MSHQIPVCMALSFLRIFKRLRVRRYVPSIYISFNAYLLGEFSLDILLILIHYRRLNDSGLEEVVNCLGNPENYCYYIGNQWMIRG